MNNFEFYCPTKIVFGKGSIAKLKNLIDKNKKVLMIYGGGSIKKNGVYEQVKNALKDYNLIEFSGIEPNPTYETCMKAVELARKENVDFLLAVGGGSVLDGTKFIAAAVKYKGQEPYELVSKGLDFEEALPVGAVMTLPATGSEMNCAAVISRISTKEKFAMRHPNVYPEFSIIDPETTFSLPIKQVRNGIIDTFVHVMELYATYDVNTPLQDSWALGLVKTLIQETPKVIKNNKDYDAKANICWCATCGLNYWLSLGAVQDWSTHRIGHELTALYGLAHGQSLAIVLPRLWEARKKDKANKLAKLAREAFNCKEIDDLKAADCAIKKTEKFFKSIGMPTKFSDYKINPLEAAQKVKERFEQRGTLLGEDEKVTPQMVYDILKNC
ncbi:MAG: iron-containing alcohol dehydrogenase [Candidatus Gastranaerophilales bacterium]|nr:iron-containing alcohol dehydrogenase [Candidatus Gastranaerophilales bacterium]